MAGQAGKFRILLPKTKFPSRINPITQEPAIQRAAKFNELYKWQLDVRAKKPNRTYTLHDGPPYANGDPHMGHVLNKVLKDFVNRYKLMQGFRVQYRPGWDCHGLPIELKACKEVEINQTSPLTVRNKAAQFASKALKSQRESFKRWGCLGDWENPYITMDKEYEADQIKVFYEMYKRGCIYRGFKPVYWSPSTGTALAEAELEYKDHTSQAVYVLFPITNFRPTPDVSTSTVFAAVWTTTPWTLLANKAICFNPEHTYSFVRLPDQRVVILGESSIPRLSAFLEGCEVITNLYGKDLQGLKYTNPLDSSSVPCPFLPGTHVTETEGTGLVHTAPAHGFEDYLIGVQNGLNLNCVVDDHGKYTSEVGVEFEGLFVLEKGNEAAITKLSSENVLLNNQKYNHRYPYDWRSKKPVIIRSTEQWFASVKQLKAEAKSALLNVQMHPPSSKNRLLSMLDSRDDWCISRQRVWGVPLPIFYHRATGEPVITSETIMHVESLIRNQGSDCWWRLSTEELLPPSLSSQADNFVKGTDTMDVWFDSGSSWAAALRDSGCVADLYLEGSDQHRGWFQSSLLTSIAAKGKAPYKAVITHGFVLDGNSIKMSKSLGNVISPNDILNSKKFGADVMRLWVASTNYTTDVHLSDGVLQQTDDFLQKIRNVCRFMLGNLSGFDASKDLLPYSKLSKLDCYLLHIASTYSKLATDAYESYNFARVNHQLVHMIPKDISSFYFDIIKDRLYCDPPNAETRRSVQTVLHHLLVCLVKSIAPFTPHLVEEIAQHYPFEEGEYDTRYLFLTSYFRGEFVL